MLPTIAGIWFCLNSPPRADWLIAEPGTFRAHVSETEMEYCLDNGLIRRVIAKTPNGASVAFDNLMDDQALLRAVQPEARLTVNGKSHDVGGLRGQPNQAFLLPGWRASLQADPGAFRYLQAHTGPLKARFEWKKSRHHAPRAQWPPPGVELEMDYVAPENTPELVGVSVTVHYELYDDLPLLSKWIVIHNGSAAPLTVNSYTSELLAAVEQESLVDSDVSRMTPQGIHVESDYAFGDGGAPGEAGRWGVRWISDPTYETQVNYERKTRCLLEARPDLGPAQVIPAGADFESHRIWELVEDSGDRERRGLALRRMYRTIAPWVTENPLMMHVRFADRETVHNAIDQCAAVGFEMVILTFGSGFDLEDSRAESWAKWREYADYARSKGIEFGGYSLLASRSINSDNDVLMPPGKKPRFDHSPCLGSPWGVAYFDKLYRFFDATGFSLLEHDGSYPGDECGATAHPGHRGLDDSRWTQWRTISGFYRWCRGQGIFLNVPDWYYLNGAGKCGMGYRETNWSLPREQQVLHTRQNIYDGTWIKTPSMGWMMVPLTEYQGGGAAATIEPLHEHLDHYERMLVSNLAHGVQACYRGPRLYDTNATRDMLVKRVAWFHRYRDILESDLIHGRRADGRDLDWMLHVNPHLKERGMLVVFNPLDQEVRKTLRVPLYYSGLRGMALIAHEEAPVTRTALNETCDAMLDVVVPARGFTWYVIRAVNES